MEKEENKNMNKIKINNISKTMGKKNTMIFIHFESIYISLFNSSFPGKSESKDSPEKEKSDPPKAKPVKTPPKGGKCN